MLSTLELCAWVEGIWHRRQSRRPDVFFLYFMLMLIMVPKRSLFFPISTLIFFMRKAELNLRFGGLKQGIKRQQILSIFLSEGCFTVLSLLRKENHRSALGIANFTQSFQTHSSREVGPQKELKVYILSVTQLFWQQLYFLVFK